MLATALVSALAFSLTASAAPIESLNERATCPSYIIITTRGTFELQGPSISYTRMNAKVTAAVPGGTLYNTVYPANFDQNSAAATTDIINQITTGLARNPNQCYVLEGYSQGAAATVNAMPRLTGNAFNAVKAVVLTGNPYRKAGLNSNRDEFNGGSTANVNGLASWQNIRIPDNWVSKTRDICWRGDGICDTQNGGANFNHLQYGNSDGVQQSGADFIIARL